MVCRRLFIVFTGSVGGGKGERGVWTSVWHVGMWV